MNPYHTAPKEQQSDMGPYCLQYRLTRFCNQQMRGQMAIFMNGGKRVQLISRTISPISLRMAKF